MTITDDDDVFQRLGIFHQRNHHGGGGYCLLADEAHVGEYEHCAFGHFHLEVTVEVGDCGGVATLSGNFGTNQGLAQIVLDKTFYLYLGECACR